jgi:hypothetical protein
MRIVALEVLSALLVDSSGFLKAGRLASELAAFETGPAALVLDDVGARLLSDLITGLLLLLAEGLETEAGTDLGAELLELGATCEAAGVDLFTGAAAAVGASCSIWAAPF